MLDEMDKKLSKYKDEINKSDLSVHEIITLASVVELEGAKATDRKGVAGVFYNRLASSAYPTLGSDATTYYASKIDDWKIMQVMLSDRTEMFRYGRPKDVSIRLIRHVIRLTRDWKS